LAFAVAAIAGFAGPAAAGDTINVGKAVPFAWTFIPVEVGIEAGIWKKHGFDEVKVHGFGGDARMQQGLISKAIDFGLGSGPGMAFAAKGGAGMPVAAFATGPRNLSLSVLHDSTLSKPSEFKGKKLGVTTAGSLTDWLTRRLSQVQGWGPEGITPVALGGLEPSLAGLKTRQVDGLVVATEVSYMLEEKKEAKPIYNFGDLVKDFHTHVIFARRDIIASNPALVQRFVDGWFDTIAYMYANKAKVVEVTTRVLKQPPNIANRVYDEEMQMLTRNGRFDPKAIAVLKPSFVEMKLLDTVPKDEEIFTTRFVR
jgi:ABC-type nitrate/sulfonate/bicarbonate transport system substrate-binding protein